MSLEKAIKYGKEFRKIYFDSRAVDPFCKNHGQCSWCRENRTYQRRKEQERAIQMLKELDNKELLSIKDE